MKRWFLSLRKSGWIVHSARTAIATPVSLLIARLLKMPLPYWAAITTLIVMQSNLGAALDISRRRLVGTALGAAAGGLIGSYFESNAVLFGGVLFILGILCGIMRLDPSAYRFAGIALAIVMLGGHENTPPFIVAFQRFADVAIGIILGLVFTWLWPVRDVATK